MKIKLKILLLLPALFWLASCDKSTTKLEPNLPPPVVTDKVRDIASPNVEILFVIDNSGSMSTHQDLLSRNINLFVDEIKNFGFLDYRIGVTTSTFSSGTSTTREGHNGNLIGTPNYVDRKTRDGENVLRSRLLVGTNSYTNEVFLEVVKSAFSIDAMSKTNAGFYRQNSYLAIIFITDAEDQGDVSATELHDYLVAMKNNNPNKVLSYGAIIPTNSKTDCQRDDGGVTPKRIEEFLGLTNGLFFDLCDEDYGVKLAGIAKDLAQRVAREIHLTKRPKDVTQIKVTYGTQVIPHDPKVGWIYNSRTNSILLGEDIEFTFQPEGTDLDVVFEAAD